VGSGTLTTTGYICSFHHTPKLTTSLQGITNNIIFRIDPHTGKIDEYPIPFTTPLSPQTIELPGVAKAITDRTALSCAIRKGADGNLYAANGVRNQLVRINPTTKKIDLFQNPDGNIAGNLQPFNDLYSSKDGMYVTATTGNTFSIFKYATEEFTTYNIPTPASLPLGLIVASDERVYLAEFGANKILVFDPKTEKMDEYPLPELAQFPTVVRAERDGYVYFALFVGNGIGRINMKTYEIDLYHTSQPLLIGAEDTIDSKGGVWYSAFTGNVLSRLNTDTFKYDYVTLPVGLGALGATGLLGGLPPAVDVAVNYGPGDAVWFTSVLTNQVGRYNITGLY
jgi:streptogramin lyase